MLMTLPKTQERVEAHTAAPVNKALRTEMERRLERYLDASREELSRRIDELDVEWDMERTLQANMAAVLLATLLLSRTHDRRWLGMTGAVAAFFLQHALQGWCPPLVPWRSAGVRSAREIQTERTALRILRGDFRDQEGGALS